MQKKNKIKSIYHPPLHVLLKISKSSELKSIELYNYCNNKPWLREDNISTILKRRNHFWKIQHGAKESTGQFLIK
jgi:hypothetical protein